MKKTELTSVIEFLMLEGNSQQNCWEIEGCLQLLSSIRINNKKIDYQIWTQKNKPHDEPHVSRPTSAVTTKIICAAERLTKENQRLSLNKIAEKTGLSRGSIKKNNSWTFEHAEAVGMMGP